MNMLGSFFFIIGIALALHGFQVGNFFYVMGSVVLFLFGLASWGMDAKPTHSARPPSNPPGHKSRR
jgi:hypothetical protein